MAGTLITNVLLVDGQREQRGSLRTEGERIAEILPPDLPADAITSLVAHHGCERFDGRDCWLIPGGIDPHVHFSLPVAGTVTIDDFVSGTRAALAGGTTSIVDFVTPRRDEALPVAFAARLSEASRAACDFGLHASITNWRANTANELGDCVREYGARSLKLYLAYLETIGLGDEALAAAMTAAARFDLTVLIHCEEGVRITLRQRELLAGGERGPGAHPRSRPPADEADAVVRALALAAQAGCRPYIVHVSTGSAVQAIVAARAAGQKVLAETCPQYLLLDESEYDKPFAQAAAAVISPPLRSPQERDTLRQALAAETFDVVATDHCSFSHEQKALGRDDFTCIPGGAAGVEHRLALLYTLAVVGRLCDPCTWVRWVAQGPAQAFGLYPRKGSLEPGSDADLVLWDPAASRTLHAADDHHRCDHSLYEGFVVHGRARHVWLRGQAVVADGCVTATTGGGKYLWT